MIDLLINFSIHLPVQLAQDVSMYSRPVYKYVVLGLLFLAVTFTFYGMINKKPNLLRLSMHMIIILQIIDIGNFGESDIAKQFWYVATLYMFELLGLFIGSLIPLTLLEPFYIHIPASIVYCFSLSYAFQFVFYQQREIEFKIE